MKNNKTVILLGSGGTVVIFFVVLLLIFRNIFGLNVVSARNRLPIFIPTGSVYEEVLDTLKANLIIKNIKIFDWLAKKKNLPNMIRPGRYLISKSLSYNSLINLLRSGNQSPVRVTFSKARTLNQIAGKIGKQIEADSLKIISFFSNDSNYIGDGFNKQNIISLFIPNTYEFYWNTDCKGLYDRMLREYNIFWNEQRLSKAKEMGLNQKEVTILASIIDDEVAKADEKPRIAGVYLNRLKRGIPLQSCPTIKFALNDFTITRVLKKYLDVDSPYNTYRHSGFPPGPIGCASVEGVDAVLNAEKHDWLFFAAKADFSGYHNFSRTLSEHNRYAKAYQKELDKRKIFR